MFDGGVKANHTDPLLEHPLGSLGSNVAWEVSSVMENGTLLMTVALAKWSLVGPVAGPVVARLAVVRAWEEVWCAAVVERPVAVRVAVVVGDCAKPAGPARNTSARPVVA